MGTFCPSDDDINSVLACCPNVNPVAVRDLLYVTYSVEETVNRILDGNLIGESELTDSGTSEEGPNVKRIPSSSPCSSEVLPDILPKKRKTDIPSNTPSLVSTGKSAIHLSKTFKNVNASTSMPSSDGKYYLHSDSDSEESVSCLNAGTIPFKELYVVSSDEDEVDSLPLPSLRERLKEQHSTAGFTSNNTYNTSHKFLNSASSKASKILSLDSDSDSNELPDVVPISKDFSTPSPSSASTSAALSNYSVPKPYIKNTVRSVSSLVDSQETVSSVSTMESQDSVDDLPELQGRKKKKRSPAEVAEQKRLAEQKKKDREKDNQAKKRQKEVEKAEKKAALDARKCMRPGECLKYVLVKFDTSILQSSVGPAILKLLQEANIQYEIVSQLVPGSVTWTRKVLDAEIEESTPLSRDVDENYGILIVPVQEFVSMIHATLHVDSTDMISLPEFAWQASSTLHDKQLSIIVQGMEKYFRDVKTIGQRQFKEAVRSTDPGYNSKKKQKGLGVSIVVSRFDMEQALLELQLSPAGCSVSLVETAEEVAKVIFRQTKAVAEAPFKRERNQPGFTFLPENKGSVKIDKDGAGLLKLWKQQLCQFHNLSPEMANAIVAEYASPRLLVQAYENCPTKKAAERLLEDVRVRRGAGVLETSRRVGKEMSRRIYELFTGVDSNAIIH